MATVPPVSGRTTTRGARARRWPSAARRGALGRGLLLVLVLGLASSACFEAGPLGVGPPDTGEPLFDTAPPVDTASPEDTATTTPPPDASGDTGGPVDAVATDTTPADTAPGDTDPGDTGPGDTSAPADTSGARPCLTVSDCEGITGGADLCDGVVGCVDYRCVVDPATVVTCPSTGDPCLESACDPATGACVTTDLCVCAPVGALGCGAPVSYATGDAGETSVMSGYSCPGAAGQGDGPERVFTFEVPTSQRVRISAVSDGVSGVFAVGRDGDGGCLPEGCVAGGPVALFDAVGGTSYAVAVEHGFAGLPVTLRADCGITTEGWCTDGLDDDGDGLTDCADDDCWGVGPCPAPPTDEVGLCFDEVDNDDDGATDCADDDCWGEPQCVQACSVTSVSVLCGFSQGSTTGGGKTQMNTYSCHSSPALGKEIVYRFVAPSSGPVTVSMSSGSTPLALYLLSDQGLGCTPLHCLAYGPKTVQFNATGGTTYFFAIDAPEGVTGSYSIAVDCDL